MKSQGCQAGPSGFTLVEVMVACGLASILLIAITSGISLTTRIMRRTTLQMEWQNLIQLIRATYSNPVQCQSMFFGMVYDGSPLSLTELGLKLNRTDPAYSSKFLTVGLIKNGIKPLSIDMLELPGTTTQSTSTSNGVRKFDQVYFHIEANRIVAPETTWRLDPVLPVFAQSGSSSSSSASSVGDLYSGRDSTDSNTIQMIVYKDPTSNQIQECNALAGNVSVGVFNTGYVSSVDPSVCAVKTGTTLNNQLQPVECDPGSYLISVGSASVKGDQDVTAPHQCSSGEFQSGASCWCAGSANNCCNTAIHNCNYQQNLGKPDITVSQVKCCKVMK